LAQRLAARPSLTDGGFAESLGTFAKGCSAMRAASRATVRLEVAKPARDTARCLLRPPEPPMGLVFAASPPSRGRMSCEAVAPHASVRRANHPELNSDGLSRSSTARRPYLPFLIRILRYSTTLISDCKESGPLSGIRRAASSSSPLQVHRAL